MATRTSRSSSFNSHGHRDPPSSRVQRRRIPYAVARGEGKAPPDALPCPYAPEFPSSSGSHRQHPPGPWYALQVMLASVYELDARASHKWWHGTRYEHLAWAS